MPVCRPPQTCPEPRIPLQSQCVGDWIFDATKTKKKSYLLIPRVISLYYKMLNYLLSFINKLCDHVVDRWRILCVSFAITFVTLFVRHARKLAVPKKQNKKSFLIYFCIPHTV